MSRQGCSVRTYLKFQLVLKELEGNQGGGQECYVGIRHPLPEETKVSVQSSHAIRTSGPPEAALGLLFPLVHPVQGEAIKKGGVFIVCAHLDELPLPVFVRLLEDGKNGSPSNGIQADPQAVSGVLGLKKKQKHVH